MAIVDDSFILSGKKMTHGFSISLPHLITFGRETDFYNRQIGRQLKRQNRMLPSKYFF